MCMANEEKVFTNLALERSASRGTIKLITGTDPSAGSEISETVPSGKKWRLISLFIELATDSTTADRKIKLVIDDGSTTFWNVNTHLNHPASDTRNYVFASGHQQDTDQTNFDNDKIALLPLPNNLILKAGYRIQTITANLQSGDNYSAPKMLVEEWVES